MNRQKLPQNREIPTIDPSVYLAEGAICAGSVQIGKDSSVWFNAVLRGDSDSIQIGTRSNIQDGCVLHTDPGHPIRIGDEVSIGHGAILHGCTVGDHTVVGMGAIVLNGAVIGKDCLIGAGALVTGGTVIPDGSLAFGSPAKVIRPLTDKELAGNLQNAAEYAELAARNRD
ncbi:MAG: gamma carbonic anhydrase family protein [Lachnospiraceae bacterium]